MVVSALPRVRASAWSGRVRVHGSYIRHGERVFLLDKEFATYSDFRSGLSSADNLDGLRVYGLRLGESRVVCILEVD